MASSNTRQLPGNIDVILGNRVIARVILTSAVPKLAAKYDLTPEMIEEMGKFTGGYPMIDMRVVEGLVKRRIIDLEGEFTALGRRLSDQMFAVIAKS